MLGLKTLADRVGYNIKRLREYNDMSQTDLAELTGLTPAAVSHIETGRRTPRAKTIIKLANALDCSSDNILGLKAWYF